MFDSLIRFVRDQYRTDDFIPQHATTTCGLDLVAVEAQHTNLAEIAGMATLVITTKRLGRVFDKNQTPALTDRDQRIELDRMAEGVHRQTCPDSTLPNASTAIIMVVNQSMF